MLTEVSRENMPTPPFSVKLGRMSEKTERGRISPRKELTPFRFTFCSPKRSPPVRSAVPSSPPNTIMTTENMVSRARAGLLPCSISAEIIITSMPVTARVRISVPSGSFRISAR